MSKKRSTPRTWTVQTVTLQGSAPRAVSAFVSGAWAIHWTADGDGEGWRLTHVPTGFKVPLTLTDLLVTDENGPERLQRLAQLLDEAADWSGDDLPADYVSVARDVGSLWLGEAA